MDQDAAGALGTATAAAAPAAAVVASARREEAAAGDGGGAEAGVAEQLSAGHLLGAALVLVHVVTPLLRNANGRCDIRNLEARGSRGQRLKGLVFPMSASHVRPAAARVQSVERAAALLRAVAAATGPDGTATALGESVGLNRTTSWRLLTTLEQQQLVRRDEASGTYSLGPGLLDLADRAAGAALARAGRETCCSDLADQARETAALAVVRDGALTYVAEASAGAVVAAGWLGRQVPLHATSTGKVLLAFSPVEDRRAMLGPPPDGGCRGTRRRRSPPSARWRRSSRWCGRAGTPCAAGSSRRSAWGVSAPVLDLVGRPVAVVSLWGPSERLTEDRFESLGRLAVVGAAEVARRRTGAHHEATGTTGDRLVGPDERRRPAR